MLFMADGNRYGNSFARQVGVASVRIGGDKTFTVVTIIDPTDLGLECRCHIWGIVSGPCPKYRMSKHSILDCYEHSATLCGTPPRVA